MFFIQVFNVIYKSEKNMFMFFICKLMFLTSMT